MKSAQRLIPAPLILAFVLPFAGKAEDSEQVKKFKIESKARIEALTKKIEANAKMHEASAASKMREAEVAETVASITRTAIETAKWYKANKSDLNPVVLKTKIDGVYDRFHKESKITGAELVEAMTVITKALKGYPEMAPLIEARLPSDIDRYKRDGRLSPSEVTKLGLNLGVQVSSANKASTGQLLAATPPKTPAEKQ